MQIANAACGNEKIAHPCFKGSGLHQEILTPPHAKKNTQK
jgi:hypothetical protein